MRLGHQVPAKPERPIVAGSDSGVLVPGQSTTTTREVEPVVLTGAPDRYLDSLDQAADGIARITVSNDVSEVEFRMERSGQCDTGKNCETFNLLGPSITSYDEVRDPQNLSMRLWVNGTLKQNSDSSNMIFSVSHLFWYVSQFLVLRPGHVINTGTPPGVSPGLADHPYLRAGDVMEVQIEGLGRQRQVMGAA